MLRTTLLLVIAAITAEYANGLRVKNLLDDNLQDIDGTDFAQIDALLESMKKKKKK